MTGDTHREGGMLVSLAGFLLLKNNNLLLPDVNEAIQLLIIYPFALWGSTASDLDHKLDSAPSKDVFSRIISRSLHLTSKTRDKMENMRGGGKKSPIYHLLGIFDASHRSWQTHSDLTLFVILTILWGLVTDRFSVGFTGVDTALASLVLMGIGLGVTAHLILDMLTPQGVWCTIGVALNKLLSLLFRREIHLLPEKLKLVPKWSLFTTGSTWEDIVCKILGFLKVVSVVYLGIKIICPEIFPYEIKFI